MAYTNDMSAHALALEGVRNARELGGYAAADGRSVKRGLLLRTARLDRASDADVQRLAGQYKLELAIDLRASYERERDPEPVWPNVKQIHIDIMADTMADAGVFVESWRDFKDDPVGGLLNIARSGAFSVTAYRDMMMTRSALTGWRRFFELLLEPREGAVLWHCTSGKDRTGIAAALTLLALGADRETVLYDFMLTNDFTLGHIAALEEKARARGADDALMAEVRGLVGVRRESMEILLDHMESAPGGIPGYLERELGIGVPETARLRGVYLE